MQGFPIPQKDFYKVYVRSITYNQAPYIEDCLNGVAMQKTDFPFIHHVIDDCSTDGEQDVIKAWIKRECDNAEYYDNDLCTITFAKHKTNPQYTIVAYFLKRNMYRERVEKEKLYTPWREVCPYEALCEGDDYWTDNLKLQIQVDFLNSHRDYSMCFHNAKIQKHQVHTCNFCEGRIIDKDYSANEILSNWIVPTASVVLKSEVFRFPLKGENRILYGDIVCFLSACTLGKVRGMSITMSVYRINSGGVTISDSGLRSMYEKLVSHYEFIEDNFPSIEGTILNEMFWNAYCLRAETHIKRVLRLNDYRSAYKIKRFATIKRYFRNRILASCKDFVEIIFNR